MATLSPASEPPSAACARAGTRRGSSARRAPRRVAATRASGDVADASVASDARRSAFPRCVGTVTRTDSRGRRYEFYVVGTVHTPGCASAEEVREVIERVRPDAVVLELDQERLDITVANAMVATGRTEYGADLLAGATAAERLGALVVLGDAKARSLPELARARLLTSPADLADLPRLWRSLQYLGRALGASGDLFPAAADDESVRSRDADAPRFVRFAEALAADPGKLLPLRGPAAVAALALLASAREAVAAAAHEQAVPPIATLASSVAVGLAPSPADAVAAALTALAVGRATEVLLETRDEILATSAARAAAVAAATDGGALRRVAHAFDADADATAAAARAEAETPETPRRSETDTVALPCFTLRRPLGAGETRRLNLFEPRWLAMIDAAAEARGGDPRGARIACGLAVNRRYVASAWLSDVGAKDVPVASTAVVSSAASPVSADVSTVASSSSRCADLVVEPSVRVATIVDVREGRREVTGARRLEVWIRGGEETRRAEAFDARAAGYLRATLSDATRDGVKDQRSAAKAAKAPTSRADAETFVEPARAKPTKPTRVVCVVGLAHCNGVLSRLADANVEAYETYR